MSYREQCRDSDHYDTSAAAYELLKPFVPAAGRLWEPFFNTGACAAVMRAVFDGCEVIHEDRDAAFWRPDCDVIVANPPFSTKARWLAWALRTGKPFAMLLPAEFLMSRQFRGVEGHADIQVLLGSRRLPYEREGVSIRGNFESAWLCKGLLPKQLVFG